MTGYWTALATHLAPVAATPVSPPTPTPTAPVASSADWKDVIAVVNDSLRTAAVLIGGGFAYFKYVHGRIHYPSLTLGLEAKIIKIDQHNSLSLATKITNSGTYRMVFDMGCHQQLTVHCLEKQQWVAGCNGPRLPWSATDRIVWDQLVDDNGFRDLTAQIEPGESVSSSWVVRLPPGDWVAYRVTLRADARTKMLRRTSSPIRWVTRTVVTEV